LPSYILGLDIGGTFTDLVCTDLESGDLKIAKVPSTPPDYIEGILNALRKVNVPPSEVKFFKHGSTVGTNAITQRVGIKTGLVTTKGFRDVLLAARGDRSSQYDLSIDLPAPLVQRRDILTVSERINADGQVVTKLDEDEARRVARVFKKRQTVAIAVAFINSFMNPSHEYLMKKILNEECPDSYVCASYDVSPEVREFERTSTVSVNAYLLPVIANYVEKLQNALRDWGYQKEVLLVHSGGGVMSVELFQPE
jgi:N-methylhydantoinase A